ncbi:unnamed protein product [Pseudo-nitzschia multistriata]|uniref:Uncharacterized protein n=1 Tax=Pseudo-nitzschia multistriata TaxID=183589 RepID=A0A448ZEG7_9STRA|nr:unnamed protein product [Pseudo-nitzschia multistriata]
MMIALYFKVFSFLAVLSYCESNANPNYDKSSNYQHQYEQPREQHHPSPPSSSNVPRLIGLNVNGRMKCLLWGNPGTFSPSALTPLFSSPIAGNEEDNIHADHDCSPSRQVETRFEGIGERTSQQNDEKTRSPSSLLLPGAVFATTDYRFRKDRWYGVERIGMIFRWNVPSSLASSNKSNGERQETALCRSRKRIASLLPTTIDVTAQHSLFSPHSSKSTRNHRRKNYFAPFADSGNIRVGWRENEESDETEYDDARGCSNNPWIQIGFEQPLYATTTIENDDLLSIDHKQGTDEQNPFHLRFFFPLIRRRLDLQWTSFWGNGITKDDFGRDRDMGNRRQSDDPWWMPQVSLDPSMGIFSSENRYRNSFAGRDERQYCTDFKLRLRTTMPTLLSSVSPSEDDDLQTASLRFDCSFMTDSGNSRTCRSPGFSTVTTTRFETIVVPSFLWRSVTETARFGLFHEQNHGFRN